MNTKTAAEAVRSKGRGPDTMLIHMTPGEVAGLQALAEQHGGSLTINPETGLPEANFLESILPAVVGIGLTVASGGALSPLMAAALVGGGAAIMTGDLKQGLMAGLGAYGGAGLGAGLVAPAAASTAAAAAPVATTGIGAGAAGTTAGAAAAEAAAAPVLTTSAAGAISPAASSAALDVAAQNAALAEAGWAVPAEAYTPAALDVAAQNAALAEAGWAVPADAVSSQAGLTAIAPSPTASLAPTTPSPVQVADKSWWGNLQQGGSNLHEIMTDPAKREAYVKAMGGTRGLIGKFGLAAAPYLMGVEDEQEEAQYKRPSVDDIDMRQPTLADLKAPAWWGAGAGQGGGMPRYRFNRENGTFRRYAGGGYVLPPNVKVSPYRTRYDELGLAALANQMRAWAPPEMEQSTDSPILATPAPSITSSGPAGEVSDTPPPLPYEEGEGDGEGGMNGLGMGDEGTASMGGTYAQGGLAENGFIVPADVVSALGNGSTDAGLRALSTHYGSVRPIRGSGDGLSDSIPTHIGGTQRARVADGEAYIPPQVVAAAGGGSIKKGSRKLYSMLDKVRASAHGKTQQQRPVNPRKALS